VQNIVLKSLARNGEIIHHERLEQAIGGCNAHLGG
jgi:hypothetical protein